MEQKELNDKIGQNENALSDGGMAIVLLVTVIANLRDII